MKQIHMPGTCISGTVLTAALLIALPLTMIAQGDAGKPRTDGGAAKVVQGVNGDVLAARAATRDKRYSDAEALMLKDTAQKPELILPWMELGLAQMGLKKYPEAEVSFKTALGIDTKSLQVQHSSDFYQADTPQTTHASRNTAGGEVVAEQNRTPEIKGVGYSSLGEIYIRTKRIPEAEAAFDTAVKANPSQAALYLRNETIFFFQTGNADGQLAAAEKGIAIDPTRAMLYYFKGQALASKATVDPTGKMLLPPGCAEAYQKYLQLEPNGQFANDSKSFLTAAGVPPGKSGKS
jgi:tetratricopeptide (TPR) repeat protein